VLINGTTTTVKVAHVRLCHSRMMFARAYMRESQEMVFDAHDKAFAFFRGTCTRGIYDNMKTAVEAVFVGKERLYNRRFLQMCSHYLVQPVACTPASGWEKGQVENQVGLVRERFFTPRLRFKSLEELNVWLLDKCVAYAKAHNHPEQADRWSGAAVTSTLLADDLDVCKRTRKERLLPSRVPSRRRRHQQ
jgi:transposase